MLERRPNTPSGGWQVPQSGAFAYFFALDPEKQTDQSRGFFEARPAQPS
jgi:hypothetical protein